jgi:hypothetical protein
VLVFGRSSSPVLPGVRAVLDYVRTTAARAVGRHPAASPVADTAALGPTSDALVAIGSKTQAPSQAIRTAHPSLRGMNASLGRFLTERAGSRVVRRYHSPVGRLRLPLALVLSFVTACAMPERNPADILLFNGRGKSPSDVAAPEGIPREHTLGYATAGSECLGAMSEAELKAFRLLVIPSGNFEDIGNTLAPDTTANGAELPRHLSPARSSRGPLRTMGPISRPA